MKLISNEKGMYLIGAAILAGILTTLLIFATQHRLTSTLETRSRSKAMLDAHLAIDRFAMELKRAYELATPVVESNGALPISSLPTTSWPFKPYGPVVDTIQFYIPSSSFPNNENQICAHRSDGRDSAITGGTPKICINVPADFGAQIDKDGLTLYPKYPGEPPSASKKFFALMRFLKKLGPQQASADLMDVYAPDIAAGAPPSIPLVSVNADGNPNFKAQYADFNYSVQPDKFFITVKFCVKYANNCTPEEKISQTYVFLKPPQSSLDK